MNIEELRDCCLSLGFVIEELPFGPQTLVFKVGGKMFLLVRLDVTEADLNFNVKCDPEYAVELREKYLNSIFPGYHMNKKHWNTVYCNRELSSIELSDLIKHSYSLVFDSLSNKIKDSLIQIS